MIHKALHSRWTAVILTVAITGGLLAAALNMARIDTDIMASLPRDDRVMADAAYIFKHHPIQDQVVIDIAAKDEDPDLLADTGEAVEKRLRESGLFSDVGIETTQALFPELIRHIQDNLPFLLSEDELEDAIAPLLEPERVRESLESLRADLLNLDAIGQAGMISRDPLGFRNIVLAKMAPIAPASDVQFYRGHLLSADGRHLLVVARQKSPGSDTVAARSIDALIRGIAGEITRGGAPPVTLTPVGTYRAALDNETTARADTQRAIIFATLGIALLLILVFPRPLIGLLSLVPAVAGTVAAFFVHSLVYESVSILAIGFGGAIISITVDHGMAYLLFLDRTVETRGAQAAHDVRSPGLIAALTTVGAFLALFVTGFPILEQIGLFAALGIAFSFVFVHTVFPRIFPVMPPAKSERFPWLRRGIDRAVARGGLLRPAGAALFALVMLILGVMEFREFHVDLASMNSVTAETLDAEKRVTRTWGNILGKIYLMTESPSLKVLQAEGDRLARDLDRETKEGVLAGAFVPSMLFPGREGAAAHLGAWKRFWSAERIAEFTRTLEAESARAGFSPGAFADLFRLIEARRVTPGPVPEKFFSFMGISRNEEAGSWSMMATLLPGKNYNAEAFHARHAARENVRMFDPGLFSTRLGGILMSTFLRMFLIISATIALLVFLFQLDWKLTLVPLLPVAFGMIATFGTLKVLGRPLDIPSIILSNIIMGMGVDYSLYYVRSYQRFGSNDHEHLGLIRMAILLAGFTSIIGFGVLALARHSLLRGAGLTAFLGIGYSLAGAFLILPPLMDRVFRKREEAIARGGGDTPRRVMRRYRHLETHPRVFAWFKLRLDPLCRELEGIIASLDKAPGTIIDIGCGYGIPAAWLAETLPSTRFHCIDPDGERARVAAMVLGDRGTAARLGAPDLPSFDGKADAALMIDMIHYLDDALLRQTLSGLAGKLRPGGALVIRATVPRGGRTPLLRRIETLRNRLRGIPSHFRSEADLEALITGSGFGPLSLSGSGEDREEKWLVAFRRRGR